MTRSKFTAHQRLFIHGQKQFLQAPYRTMSHRFLQRFGIPGPCRKGYLKIWQTLQHTSHTTDRTRSGRPVTATTEEKVLEVMGSVMESPKCGSRRRSSHLGQARSSLRRNLKELGMFPYRIRKLHQPKDSDDNKRLLFSHWFDQKCQTDPFFEDLIIWSDEAQRPL